MHTVNSLAVLAIYSKVISVKICFIARQIFFYLISPLVTWYTLVKCKNIGKLNTIAFLLRLEQLYRLAPIENCQEKIMKSHHWVVPRLSQCYTNETLFAMALLYCNGLLLHVIFIGISTEASPQRGIVRINLYENEYSESRKQCIAKRQLW